MIKIQTVRTAFMVRRMAAFLFLMVFLLLPQSLYSKQFRVLSITDGLSDNTVKCFAQDNLGLVWMGTFDGLCRFDGVDFKVYRNIPTDKNSILNNHVESLLHKDSLLWIGTENGLNCYSYKNNMFYTCSQSVGDSLLPIKYAIRTIISVEDKVVVLSKHGELFVQKDKTVFECFGKVGMNKWTAICKYRDGMLLASTGNRLYLLDLKSKKVISQIVLPSLVPVNNVLYYSKNQDLVYIGRGIGYSSMAVEIDKNLNFHSVETEIPHDLKCIVDYNNQTLFATDGGGLYTLENGVYSLLTPKNSNLSSDAIHSLFIDKENNQWIGTYRGGANFYSPNHLVFNSYSIEKSGLSHNVITALWREGSYLYIGTDGGGLDVMDIRTGLINTYTTNNSNISGNHILSVIGDDENIYLGIYGKGLCRYNKKKKQFKTYDIASLLGSQSYNGIWQIKEHKGKIWIIGEGICVFDKADEKFEVVESLENRSGYGIAFDGDDAWVASSSNGIFNINAENGELKRHYGGKKLNGISITDNIRFIFIDSKHDIWFSTESSGLFKFNKKSGEYSSFDDSNGLMNTKVVSMEEDDKSNIWIGTYNGLYYFNRKNESFVRYGEENTLSMNLFNYNASTCDGENIYFGGTNGLISFPLKNVEHRSISYPVYFTGLVVDNRTDSGVYLYGNSSEVIKLPYNENYITIHFAIPEMSEPDKIRLECKMDNYDQNWRMLYGKRYVSYSNLPPGEYVFSIKSTNSEGTWNKDISCLRIVISPPWWNTIWAKILWMSIFVGIIIMILWFYLHEMNMKHIVHLKEVEEEAARNLNEEKLRFYIDIAHELRTPIFLITSPLEELIESGKRIVQVPSYYLKGIYRNAMKLNSLIARIIDFRKLESGNLKLQFKNLNVIEYCERQVDDYRKICEQKNINFYFRPSRTIIKLCFDPDNMDMILSNLVLNAYKYTPEGGEITFSVDEDDKNVIFSVKDNGIGIDKENQQKIFDRFYRVDQSKGTTFGDGIGLSFVKKLVELHKGNIMVNSELGKGSVFIFQIPKEANKETIKQNKDDVVIVDEKKDEKMSLKVAESPVATHTLLIIDDDVEILDMLTNLLIDNYKILKATNGMDGLNILNQYIPDLVICDMMMPRMSGLEFLKRMRTDMKLSNIPVIMLTAKSSDDDKISAFDEGANDYIMKPVSIKYLRSRINHFLLKKDTSDVFNVFSKSSQAYSKDEQMFLLKCREIIDTNLLNKDFDIMLFADTLGMSHSSLYRKVKAVTGMSVIELINEYRIFKAVQYMKEGESNICTICTKCGFNDAKNFRETFKKKMNITPKQFVKSL